PDRQEELEQNQDREQGEAHLDRMVQEHRQHYHDQAQLRYELDEPRAGRAEHQDLTGEGYAPSEPGVLREDVRAGIEGLEHEVPDEIAAQEKPPVMRQRNPDHVAEHQNQ